MVQKSSAQDGSNVATNSSRGSEWDRLRLAVLVRDNYTCHYCGKEATEADHVTPKAAGGVDEMWNLVASCRPCNASKGKKINERLTWFDKNWLDYA